MSRYQTELDKLMAILEHAHKARPAMTVQQQVVFLAVARRPGSAISEIVQRTGYPTTSVSRIVDILEGKEAGLVEGSKDPLDAKRKLCYPTVKGRALITRMMMALYPGQDVDQYESETPKGDFSRRLKEAGQ